jgi:hypothetical protein
MWPIIVASPCTIATIKETNVTPHHPKPKKKKNAPQVHVEPSH